MNVVFRRGHDDVVFEKRLELLGLPNFGIDFSRRQLGRWPVTFSFALHARVNAVFLSIYVDAVLPLPLSAITHELRIVPDAQKKISANLLELIPARGWAKLLVVGIGHD